MNKTDVYYNVSKINISNGLLDHEIPSSMQRFFLLSCPSLANVRIKLNSVSNAEINIYESWQINSKSVDKMFISCDAIADSEIIFAQSDGDLNFFPSPTVRSIDNIGLIQGFSTLLLRELDKISNPYEYETEIISGATTSTSLAILLSVSLDCDKIVLILNGGNNLGTPSHMQFGSCFAQLNGATICASYGYDNINGTGDSKVTIENCRGKTLLIKSINASGFASTFFLQKFNKKA